MSLSYRVFTLVMVATAWCSDSYAQNARDLCDDYIEEQMLVLRADRTGYRPNRLDQTELVQRETHFNVVQSIFERMLETSTSGKPCEVLPAEFVSVCQKEKVKNPACSYPNFFKGYAAFKAHESNTVISHDRKISGEKNAKSLSDPSIQSAPSAMPKKSESGQLGEE